MDATQTAFIFGTMFGIAIGVACEAIAGARERRRWRERIESAEIAGYAAGLEDARRLGPRTVTLGAEVSDDED